LHGDYLSVLKYNSKLKPENVIITIIISQIKFPKQFNNTDANKVFKHCKEFIAKNIISTRIRIWNLIELARRSERQAEKLQVRILVEIFFAINLFFTVFKDAYLASILLNCLYDLI